MKIRIALLMVCLILGFAVLIPVAAQDEPEVTAVEYGNVYFEYDAMLASEATGENIEAMPYEEGMPYWAASPAYTYFTFSDYAGLPEDAFFHTPQIFVYKTADFAEFGGDDMGGADFGYQAQVNMLTVLLAEETDLMPYAEMPTTSNEMLLPFLPMFNAAQVFQAQPAYLDFQNGSGIRYLSYYSQAVNPIVDKEIFYTFQGLTDDGQYYIAAIFPVKTGLFDEDLDYDNFDYETFAADYATFLNESLAALNGQAADAFSPSLDMLDALIQSILVSE